MRQQVGVTCQLLDVDAVLLSVGQASANKCLKGKFLEEESWWPRRGPQVSKSAARPLARNYLEDLEKTRAGDALAAAPPCGH